MDIRHHYDLKPHNCFAVSSSARAFCTIETGADLTKALAWASDEKLPTQILGGGSNVLFTGDYAGLVLHIGLPGIELLDTTADTVTLAVGAGENWHQFVMHCLRNGFYGIENLALIPGTMGAAPIQNIGAYGVELASFFVALEALDMRTGKTVTMNRQACRFGYRDSIFKQQAGNPLPERQTEQTGRTRRAGRSPDQIDNPFVITRVMLQLNRHPAPDTRYGALQAELAARGQPDPTPAQVAEAVMAIRRRKLPDPAVLPNCGSFFKNPLIARAHYETLCARHGQIPAFEVEGNAGQVKVAAGWLIEKAGWKGRRRGAVGVHSEQALVLVNHGGASGAEILDFGLEIQAAIQHEFGIWLEPEVRLIA